ncbi:hypothetical protein QA645_37370 [Bradyrhizobium sp. CIAT3101]|uniref:hypothetical protein n=1 Tax=Bradyrhizobium sp. CIAT3101 TaxID=439387 RepID=UPI0024B21174|nr:hypothetical protein [Bradyrhizobium sp. CIAT3101]WFU80109.1 hypothetical protein QA645_37370 [Bradyrhizobium sp. CIAT3101]
MATRYFLRQVVDGSDSCVEIERAAYTELRIADGHFEHVLSVEDKYDVTIQNYLEFETSIVQEAVRELIDPGPRERFDQLRRLLARRLSNVLSSARLYLDTLKHHSREILADDPMRLERVEAAPSSQYDSCREYRVAEALRNYAQHRALPVHGLIGPATDVVLSMRRDFFVEPYVDPDELRKDGYFKAQVLEELPSDGEVVKLKPILRAYIDAICQIHDAFRRETRSKLEMAAEFLEAARDRFGERYPSEHTHFLGALIEDESGMCSDVVYIDAQLLKLVRYLHSDRPSMENLRHRRIEY